jgi:Mrp family chromosome partitioning ATPase/capsular polysaccharide biosynthesis protein
MQQELDLNRYLKFFWRWLWLIVACTVLAGAISYMATRAMPRVYRSSTTLLVGEDTSKSKVSQEELIISLQVASIYSGLVKRQTILENAVKALGLPMDWRDLKDRVQAVHADGSALIEIRVTDSEAERAKAIANEIARQVIQQSPTMQNNQQLEQRMQFLDAQLQTLQDNISSAESQLADKKAALEGETSARGVLDLQDEIQALELKVNSWRSTYASLVTAKPTRSPNTVTVVEAAYASLEPVSPNVPLTVLIGTLAGVVLATAALALFAFVINDRLSSSADATQVLGLVGLGSIPPFGRVRVPSESLVAVRDPSSALAEAYRQLRVSVQFAWGHHESPALLITSPEIGEGKSVTSANLAATFALAGKRTILVDLDLRHPTQHILFDLSNQGGLTGLFWGGPLPGSDDHGAYSRSIAQQLEWRLRAFLLPTGVPNLRLLPVGDKPINNPAELIDSAEMEELLRLLRREADVVVIDASPVLPVADTAVLAAMEVGVVLVAEVGRTRVSSIRQAVEILAHVQARVLGLALNRAPVSRTEYRYPYTSNSERQPYLAG